MANNVSDYDAGCAAKALIEQRIEAVMQDRNRRILESDEWYHATKTKKLAAYFAGLGYRILKCKFKEEKATYAGVARLLFNNRVHAIPLAKKLAHMKEDVFVLSFEGMTGAEKSGMIQLCQAFEKCGWISLLSNG